MVIARALRAMLLVTAPLAVAALGGCAASQGGRVIASGATDATRYEAHIRRTAYGVAHIEARDLPGLGFGEGYAQAEDHVCTIADQVVRARGERARFFGRGAGDQHLRSDVIMRGLRVPERAAELLAVEPPEIRAWVAAFAAGYNHYLAETSPDALPPWCRNQPWVRSISADDIAAVYRLSTLGTVNFVNPLFTAHPPADAPPDGAAFATADLGAELARVFPTGPTSSNGWAIGRDHSESGRGMLLANPHYPWYGSNRFWEKHLRIPGELDVYGVNLVGGIGVLLGFNEHVAWTHTTSPGTRYTLHAVDLVPESPTRYRYGGAERAMTAHEVAIEVQGEATPVRHTLWSTHHGPVFAPTPLPWSGRRAFSIRHVNEENGAMFRHILATSRARSLDDLRRAHADLQALPNVTTIAVSADGIAWFADAAPTPHLSEAALAAWETRRQSDALTGQLWQNRIVLLDGSDPRETWVQDPAAARPGLVPFARSPQLERTDYVFNANDSYWVAHAEARIEGAFSPLHGLQRAPISPRTRSNVLHLANGTADRPAGSDGRFSLDEMMRAVLSNRSHTADLLLPDLLARCEAESSVTVDGRTVDLADACRVLAAWDRRYDLDSRGAVLFREWIGRYPPPALLRRGELFAEDFDPAAAVATPRALGDGAVALQNLARALLLLESRGHAAGVPLGELQYTPAKLPRRIPLHGGNGQYEGILNYMMASVNPTTLEPLALPVPVSGSRFLTDAGYPVLHGTSFLMALEYAADGPRAMAFLTYGQSGDPASPHFTDQTELFSRKEWRRVLFRPADVEAGTERTYTVRGGR